MFEFKQNNKEKQAFQFAKDYWKEKILADKFFKTYFEESKDIGDLDTLLELAREAVLIQLS